MLRITKQADYGIVLLTYMAVRPQLLYKAPRLAAEVALPQPIVSKILKLLAKSDLLDSQRGAKGGYVLARRPEEISVEEVITALEGPIAVTECVEHLPGECVQESICPVRTNWQRINEAIRGALADITLAEMVHPLPHDLVTLRHREAGTLEVS